jgi:hypothetical protein
MGAQLLQRRKRGSHRWLCRVVRGQQRQQFLAHLLQLIDLGAPGIREGSAAAERFGGGSSQAGGERAHGAGCPQAAHPRPTCSTRSCSAAAWASHHGAPSQRRPLLSTPAAQPCISSSTSCAGAGEGPRGSRRQARLSGLEATPSSGAPRQARADNGTTTARPAACRPTFDQVSSSWPAPMSCGLTRPKAVRHRSQLRSLDWVREVRAGGQRSSF